MTSLVLGVIGAVVGTWAGIGPQAGFAIGSAIGGAIDPPSGPDQTGPRLNDLSVQNSSYGAYIPIIYGSYRLSGNVIWAEDIKEHKHEEEVGGKGGGGATSTTYTYTCSFAVSICEGGDGNEAVALRRIFADNKLIYDVASNYDRPPTFATKGSISSFDDLFDHVKQIISDEPVGFDASSFAFYSGSEDQMPDPTMEASLGVGNVPAYRGQSYIVLADMELANYGNRIPNLSFEVVKNGTYNNDTIIDDFEFTTSTAYTSLYNPVRNEIWEFHSYLPGVVRRDATTGDVLGTISTSSFAAGIEGQYFAGPVYDPVNGYIYVGTYSPRKLIQFDAASATAIQAITWSSGTTDYFNISPVTGIIWRTAIVSGGVHLQSKNPHLLSDIYDTNITAQFASSPRIIFDSDGNPWLFDGATLRFYSQVGGTLLFTYTDPLGFGDVIYDPDRDSFWFTTDHATTPTTRPITGIALGNPTIVSYGAGSGPAFVGGQSVTITNGTLGTVQLFNGPSGNEYTCLSATPTTATLDIDSSDMSAYISGGSIKSGVNLIREFSLQTRSVVRTVNTGTCLGGLNPALLYDSVRRSVWAINDNNYTNLTQFSTEDGVIIRRISVSPLYRAEWAIMVGKDIWYIDDSEELIRRIRLSSTLNADDVDLSYIVYNICTRSTLQDAQINVAQLEGINVRGYGITASMSGRAGLEALMNGYLFDSVDSDGVVKFPKRGGNPVVTIPSSDMVDTE